MPDDDLHLVRLVVGVTTVLIVGTTTAIVAWGLHQLRPDTLTRAVHDALHADH